jgi:hypothetical protein
VVDPQRDLAEPGAQLLAQFGEPLRPGRIVGHDLDRVEPAALGTPSSGADPSIVWIIRQPGDGLAAEARPSSTPGGSREIGVGAAGKPASRRSR